LQLWVRIMQVMLISLKAGGVGINLTAASNAFLLVRMHLYPSMHKQRDSNFQMFTHLDAFVLVDLLESFVTHPSMLCISYAQVRH